MCCQLFSFASKKVQRFSSDRKILMSLLSVLFHLQKPVSVFWNFKFWPRYLGKRSLCLWNQPHFLRNSDKNLLSPKKNNLWEMRHGFVDHIQLRTMMPNVFTNIPCTFFLFKASAFLQIFFLRNLLFWQVLRASFFLNGKCLKTSSNRTHFPLFNFVCFFNSTKDVAINKPLN